MGRWGGRAKCGLQKAKLTHLRTVFAPLLLCVWPSERISKRRGFTHRQQRISDLRLRQGRPIGTVLWMKCWNDLNEGRLEKNLDYWARTRTASGPQLDHTRAT